MIIDQRCGVTTLSFKANVNEGVDSIYQFVGSFIVIEVRIGYVPLSFIFRQICQKNVMGVSDTRCKQLGRPGSCRCDKNFNVAENWRPDITPALGLNYDATEKESHNQPEGLSSL